MVLTAQMKRANLIVCVILDTLGFTVKVVGYSLSHTLTMLAWSSEFTDNILNNGPIYPGFDPGPCHSNLLGFVNVLFIILQEFYGSSLTYCFVFNCIIVNCISIRVTCLDFYYDRIWFSVK